MHQTYDIEASDELAWVGQLQMPQRFTLKLRRESDGGPDVDLTWEVRNGRLECVEVHIKATDDGHEIRVTGLAGIRVKTYLEFAVRVLMAQFAVDPDTHELRAADLNLAAGWAAVDETRSVRAAGRRVGKVKMTDEFLREVAEVYRENVSDKPTEAVAEYFDREHRTAALYVKRARERGFLGPAIKGKAGEQ